MYTGMTCSPSVMTCTRAARAAGSLTAYWVGWSMERSPVKRMGQRHDSSVPHSLHLLIASMIIVWLQRVHVAFRGALFHWLFWHLVYHRLVAQLTALLSLLRIGAVGEVENVRKFRHRFRCRDIHCRRLQSQHIFDHLEIRVAGREPGINQFSEKGSFSS